MFNTQKPVVDAWFVNITGRLLKVKLLIFSEGKLQRVLIQHLDGTTKIITKDAWFNLRLNKHIHDVGLTMPLY